MNNQKPDPDREERRKVTQFKCALSRLDLVSKDFVASAEALSDSFIRLKHMLDFHEIRNLD
jgi:hypothetical protein